MKLGPIAQFIAIGSIVGIIAPFFLSLCLFGSTLQVFMAAEPTPGYWSGAPTPAATAVPSQVQVWTSSALKRAGGGVFVLWSLVGAFVGEAVGNRWPGHPWHRTRMAWLGAIVGGLLFSAVALFSFLPWRRSDARPGATGRRGGLLQHQHSSRANPSARC